jgi:hypothetical protein
VDLADRADGCEGAFGFAPKMVLIFAITFLNNGAILLMKHE